MEIKIKIQLNSEKVFFQFKVYFYIQNVVQGIRDTSH